jgi:hypothetical protein
VYAVVEKYLVAWHGYAVFDVFCIYTVWQYSGTMYFYTVVKNKYANRGIDYIRSVKNGVNY